MAAYQVLLADDHAMFRGGLKKILEETGDVDIIAEAGDGLEVIRLLDQVSPQVVILDISMPHLGGLEALSRIRALKPDIKVLILTMHKDIDFLRRAISAGAAGYLLKEDAESEIISALEAISRGKTYVSPLLASSLLEDLTWISRQQHAQREPEPLTTREKEVLKLIAEGKSNKEIAASLFISIHTVVRHRANLMHKLNLKNTADIVKYAMQKGYL